MRISSIRKLNEKTPYWIKRPFARVIRNRLIKNKDFLCMYELLSKADGYGLEEIKSYQLEELKKTLQHAYDHTEYYHKLFDECGFMPERVESIEDLSVIPLMTKELLKEHLSEITADDIKDYYYVTTGGTTGEPTKIYMDRKAIYKEWAFIYHYWSKYGYDFRNSRLATFRGVDMGEQMFSINPLYSEIRLNPFILNNHNIHEYVSIIDDYKADFIYGYPSAIYNFCRIARANGINLYKRFKGALFISENLYEHQEELIKDVLECPMVIFYGQTERAVLAERYDKGYVFNDLYGVTEFDVDGSPIVTGFINPKTPLIRFLVDDYAEQSDRSDSDLLHYRIIGHRSSEVLYGSDGEQVSVAAINFHDDTFLGVRAYQFIQNECGKCIVNIVPDEGFDDRRLEVIKKRITDKLGAGFTCYVVKAKEIKLSDRGKYNMIVQNIK